MLFLPDVPCPVVHVRPLHVVIDTSCLGPHIDCKLKALVVTLKGGARTERAVVSEPGLVEGQGVRGGGEVDG